MIKVLYDYVSQECSFFGDTIENRELSLVLCNNSVTCSAEDILDAYVTYGEECIKHLQGAFSFALFDRERKCLMVVRDKLGGLPMYYSQLPTGIIFSTSLKEILPSVKCLAIRPHELAQPIRHNYPVELQRTWIEQIMRLRAGEYAMVDKDGLRLHTYFKRDHTPTFNGTKEEAIQESLRLMRASVKQCVETSPGPVALMLSGGIDSTSLATFTKEIQQEVHVFSAGYNGNRYKACDERPVARRFAEEKGLVFHDVELNVNDFQSYLDELLPFLDEPAFDVNCMVQYAVYKKASEMGFKTILSGLGGDEQFYSYQDMHKLVKAIQSNKEFADLYPTKKNKKRLAQYVLHNFKSLLLPTQAAIRSGRNPNMWTYDDYIKFASSAVLDYGNETVVFKDIDVAQRFPENVNINSIYDYMFSTFANTLCVYMGNILSKACGIAIQYPLLNVDLVTFLDSLPLEMKFNPEKPKQFQREIMAGILPDYILDAKKRAFEPPFEFIWKMCGEYKYKRIKADYVFFNSMIADRMIDNLLD